MNIDSKHEAGFARAPHVYCSMLSITPSVSLIANEFDGLSIAQASELGSCLSNLCLS